MCPRPSGAAPSSAIHGTAKHRDGVGSINKDLTLGDVVVRPGDWVVGDEDGVVVLPQPRLADITQSLSSRLCMKIKLTGSTVRAAGGRVFQAR